MKSRVGDQRSNRSSLIDGGRRGCAREWKIARLEPGFNHHSRRSRIAKRGEQPNKERGRVFELK